MGGGPQVKAQNLKGKYEARLEFKGVGGVSENPLRGGGARNFSGTSTIFFHLLFLIVNLQQNRRF